MLKLLIAIVAVALLYWLYRQRRHIFNRRPRPTPVVTTLEAVEIRAFLAADTPQECLESDGSRHGEAFQSKTPPDLPHGSECRCERVSLFYTSADVFQGASESTPRKTELGELEGLEATALKRALLSLKTEVWHSWADFVAEHPLDRFAPPRQEPVQALLQHAWTHRLLPPPSESTPVTSAPPAS